MNIRRALSISLMLHAIPIALLFYSRNKEELPSPKSGSGVDEKRVLFLKKEPLRVRVTQVVKKNGLVHKDPMPTPTKKCENFYFGFGYSMSVSGDWCIITEVAPGSPLDRLGLVPGDKILLVGNDCPGRGEDGTEARITYMKRNGDVEAAVLKREKICTEK